jgi:AcrR family transcriptional regulator
MPKISAEQRQSRRLRFVEAARRLAALEGYRNLTVDEVCVEAGFSKGAFYGYFDSKNDLLLAVLDEEGRQIGSLLDDLQATGDTNVDRIRRFLRAMAERGSDRAEVQLLAELWSQAPVDNAVQARLSCVIGSRRQRLAEFARSAMADGELVEVPANAFGAVLVALADGLILHAAIEPSGFKWENVGLVIDAIFDSMAHPPPAAPPP